MLKNIELEKLEAENILPNSTTLKFNLAVDLGSTGTRGIAYPSAEDIETLPEEDSEDSFYYRGAYQEDYSDIVVMKPQVYDSLEMHFWGESGPMFSCLKGTLAKQAGTGDRVSSSTSKANQEATKVNLHSFIAMELLKYVIDSQIDIPPEQVVHIRLTLAMPPEDTDRGRIDAVKSEFTGKFTVTLPRLNKVFTYQIDAEDVVIISECNAVATYYAIMNDDGKTVDEEENVIILEGGGRSTSVGVIKNGMLVTRLNHNENDVSGLKLRDLLNDVICEKRKINRLSDANAERALKTGIIRIGSEQMDVTEEVIEAKKRYAEPCIATITRALDKAGMSIIDLQKIVYSGRLFSSTTDDKGTVIIPSLADFVTPAFSEKFKVKVEGVHIAKTYPIPAGLVIYRLGLED